MSRHLLSAFIAALIGAILLAYQQYGKLNDQLSDLAARVAQIENESAGDRVTHDERVAPDDGEAVLVRLQRLESEIAGLHENTTANTAGNGEAARPAAKPILVRKFTNRATAKTIDARLVAVAGPDVSIRRIDGKEFTIPIASLSREDQIYIAEHADAINLETSRGANPESASGDGAFGGAVDFGSFFNDSSQ